MLLAGEARKRFGGNIPLIGIATWGVIQQRESLEVLDNTLNYGYSTRRPIKYEARKYVKAPALDPNHSHFILVDDGSENQFGKEIELRAQFEACACLSKGGSEERFIADVLKNRNLGWEGGRDGWSAAYKDDRLPGHGGSNAEENLAICVCFEGGPGTIDTIYASTRNGTPALLVKGSGRAADLIADCIRVFKSDETSGDDAEEPNAAQKESCDSTWLKRLVMIRRFVIFMREMKDATLRRDATVSWPPVIDPKSVSSGGAALWKRQWGGRTSAGPGQWVRAKELAFDDSQRELVVDEENRAVLRPGELEHTREAIVLGRKLFEEYHLGDWVRAAPDFKVLEMMCNLFDSICSRLCLVYDLDARTIVDGRREHLDVLDYTVNTIALGIRADADRKACSFVMYLWRKCVLRQRAGTAVEESKQDFADNNGVLLDINSNARYLWLKLMIEWNKKDVIKGLLKDECDVYLNKRSLNRALQVALEQDRCEIAEDLLLYGADTDAYRTGASRESSISEPVWKGLLVSACAAAENEHLRILIDRGRVEDSALCSLRAISDERVLERRAHALRKRRLSTVYSRLMFLAESTVMDEVQVEQPASALSELQEYLQRQGMSRETNFNARDIVDDRQAKAVLSRIYGIIIDSDESVLLGDDRLLYIGDGGRFSFDTNADFDLFLCMLLLNRPELARLFWIRDGCKRAAAMYQNALLGCLLCRRLVKFDFVMRDKNLTSAFQLTAAMYERFSTDVLRKCCQKNVERTMSAIEQPLEQCNNWSAVDMIVRANCRHLVIECSDLCISAAVRRFLGKDGFFSTFSRLNAAWHAEMALFRLSRSSRVQPTASSSDQPLLTVRSTRRLIQGMKRRSLSGLSGVGAEAVQAPPPNLGTWWHAIKMDHRFRLAACCLIDGLGILVHIWVPYPAKLIWTPFSAFLVHKLHRNTLVTAISLLEDQLPFLRQFPTATVTCVYLRAPPEDEDKAAPADAADVVNFFPVDHFVLDVFAHLMLTYLLTTFILWEPCLAADALEALILVLFVSDELPDIILAGVDEHSIFLLPCIAKGFRAYWSLVGYVKFFPALFRALFINVFLLVRKIPSTSLVLSLRNISLMVSDLSL